jgi:hypothetical protein
VILLALSVIANLIARLIARRAPLRLGPGAGGPE